MTFTILFESHDLIAVDKPDGIASIPGAPGEPSLLALLQPHFTSKLYVVHRLDKEVSGVILFAKTAEAHRWLNAQFAGRDVRKTYLALAHGLVQSDQGTIDTPLREFGSGRVGVDPERGKPSVTEFEVVERYAAYTLLRIYPQTGRRHQIRVHLYSVGHPLVGDRRYGVRATQAAYPRLLLHAQAITLRLPTGVLQTFESPTPPSFLEGLAFAWKT